MASLADRITKPDSSQGDANTSKDPSSAPSSSQATGKLTSWADEAEDAEIETSTKIPAAKADAKEEVGTLATQTDGASEANGGEAGILEPSYDVEIKLADLQANPNDPLYSIKSFEELGL